MFRGWSAAGFAAAAGAFIGAAMLVVFYVASPSARIDFDRELPTFTSGFYPIERDGDLSFVWTSDRAVVRLAGLDRRVEWRCAANVRGARDSEHAQPDVVLSVDGTTRASLQATNEFATLEVLAPVRDRPGLTLTLSSTPTFVPGAGDTRTLGAQVMSVVCSPSGRFVWPPRETLVAAAGSSGGLALALVLGGVGTLASILVAAVVAVAHAVLIVTRGGAFGDYPALVMHASLLAWGAMLAVLSIPRLTARRTSAGSFRAVVVISAAAYVLQILAVSHPAKFIVDAVFQAHRLEWVLAGRYLFTQPLPDGVQFPYAIGLYVIAAPWTVLTNDHVLLLRVVVLVANALAGALLYWAAARWWNDRWAGVIAVAFYHAIPLAYVVVGNANLPNMFAQSIAVMTMMAITGIGRREVEGSEAGTRSRAFQARAWIRRTILVAALAALAFLSHLSTFMLLTGMLASVVVIFAFAGGRHGRRTAVMTALAAAAATIVAIGIYYRHFPEVYERALERVRPSATSPATTVAPPVDPNRPDFLFRPLALHERARNMLVQTVRELGWPMLLLAAFGAWRVGRARARDPLSLLLLAWCCAWLIYLTISTTMRVDTVYQRYAIEFIGRVNLVAYPATVLLAARGAASAQRDGPFVVKALGIGLAGLVVLSGVRSWIGWIW